MRGGWAFSLLYTGWGNRSRLENWSAQVEPRRLRIVGGPLAAEEAAAAGGERAGVDAYYLMLAAAREGLSRERAAAALRAVLLPVLERADAQGLPCYVECTDPEAAQLYPAAVPGAAGAAAAAAAGPVSLGLAAVYDELGFRVVEGEDFSLFGTPVRLLMRDPPRK